MTPITPVQADTLRVLRDWTPADVHQGSLRDEYVAFVLGHDNAVDRSCRVGHVTASALLIHPETREVLLTLHARIGRWLQLGGHIEPDRDATVLDAALRECREESGIHRITIDPVPLRLDRHEVPCSDGQGGRSTLLHWDVQFLALAHDRSHVISEESADLDWFSPEALPEVDASVSALVTAGLARNFF